MLVVRQVSNTRSNYFIIGFKECPRARLSTWLDEYVDDFALYAWEITHAIPIAQVRAWILIDDPDGRCNVNCQTCGARYRFTKCPRTVSEGRLLEQAPLWQGERRVQRCVWRALRSLKSSALGAASALIGVHSIEAIDDKINVSIDLAVNVAGVQLFRQRQRQGIAVALRRKWRKWTNDSRASGFATDHRHARWRSCAPPVAWRRRCAAVAARSAETRR